MCAVNLSRRGIRNCKWKFKIVSGIRKVYEDSANCNRNPQIVSGIRMNLRNPLKFAESGTTIYIRSLRNPQQIQCVDKIYFPDICTQLSTEIFVHWNFVTRIHLPFGTCLKTCLWNPGKYRHKLVGAYPVHSFQTRSYAKNSLRLVR